MPNLREWIEAQLKRGYSRKQIKSALIRKGYSPKAAAEVDRITSSSLPRQQNASKKQVPNKLVLIILLIAAVFALWLLAAPFLSKQADEGQEETTTKGFDEKVGLLCDKYEEQKVDCAVALKIIAESYGEKIEIIKIDGDTWIIGVTTESGYIEVPVKNREIIG